MPALNFTILVDKILSGEKTQTIRIKRKRPIKPGDKLYLYTGMMHEGCKKLGEAVCDDAKKMTITNNNSWNVFVDGKKLFRGEIHQMALDDGFGDLYEFVSFFVKTYKIKVGGCMEFDLIKWRDFKKK